MSATFLRDSERYFLLVNQLEPARSLNISSCLRLDGLLDLVALKSALQVIVDANSALRTTFELTGGSYDSVDPARASAVFRRRVAEKGEIQVEIEVSSYEMEAPEEAGGRVHAIEQEEKRRHFDTAVGPLFHFRIYRGNGTYNFLFLTIHHAILDGWSHGIMIKELADIYNQMLGVADRAPYPEKLDFLEYLNWYEGQIRDPVWFGKARDHWVGYMSGFQTPTIGRDHDLGADGRFDTLWVERVFAAPKPVLSYNREFGLSLSIVPFVAFALTIKQYSDDQKIYLINTLSGRYVGGFDDVLGLMAGTIFSKAEFRDQETILDVMRRCQDELMDGFEYGVCGFPAIASALAAEGLMEKDYLGNSEKTKILFNFLGHEEHEIATAFSGLDAEVVVTRHGEPSPQEIALFIKSSATGVHVWLGAWARYHREPKLAEMVETFGRIYQAIMADPTRPAISLLTNRLAYA